MEQYIEVIYGGNIKQSFWYKNYVGEKFKVKGSSINDKGLEMYRVYTDDSLGGTRPIRKGNCKLVTYIDEDLFEI